MNFFQLIYAFIKKNLKNIRETEDPNERKKQWIQIVFGSVLAVGYGAIHLPPDISIREIIFAVGILLITLYFVFRALKYFKLIWNNLDLINHQEIVIGLYVFYI